MQLISDKSDKSVSLIRVLTLNMLLYNPYESCEVLLRVGCEYAGWGSAGDWIAVEVGDCASCLGEDEGCGGIVPWGEKVFEIEFAASHSEIA